VKLQLATLAAAGFLAAACAAPSASPSATAEPPIAPISSAPPATASPDAASAASAGTTARPVAIGGLEAARAQVARVPGDWPAWSALGSLELERARVSGDPAAYDAAARAFETSLKLQPTDNAAALAGLASVSAARHDFATAERQARRALAVNTSSPEALVALTDALTELGRYDEALATARRLDAVRPGVASFTRLSYQAELRGDTAGALALMRRAADDAATPAQVAFARTYEGSVALDAGDVAAADAAYRAGVAVSPDDTGLLHLGARVARAQGRTDVAIGRYADLVERRPTVTFAAEQAALLTAAGRPADAAAALELARAAQSLARSARVAPEAADVLFEADHGDRARAVALGAELWRRAPSVGAADAYAWALHVAGRDREALPLARRALSLGGRPPAFVAHAKAIAAATGARLDRVP
jgi:tetratricopeptide (TPR) repeat protein